MQANDLLGRVPYYVSKKRSAFLRIELSNTKLCEGLVLKTPSWSIDDDSHQAARDDTGDRQGNNPASIDPGNHTPVDGPPGARAETHTDSGSGNTLRSRDGKLYIRVVSNSI